jgi:hypothetical protein
MDSTSIIAIAAGFNIAVAASSVELVEFAQQNVQAFNRATVERCAYYNRLIPDFCQIDLDRKH